MRTIEWVELSLVAGATFATAWLVPWLPVRLPIGTVGLVAASILLSQGLLRDVWLLWRSRRAESGAASIVQRCICLESSVGVLGIALGVVLLLSGVGGSVELGRPGWLGLVLVVLAAGFFLKDWTFAWNPWRLQREKDHASVIFTWRKK